MQPVPLTKCLDLMLQKLNLSDSCGRYQALRLWEKVCGSDTAKISKAQTLRGDTLTVAVKDHIWASELSNFQLRFIENYQRLMDKCTIKKIRFVPKPALFAEKKKKSERFDPALAELSAKDKKKAEEMAGAVRDEKARLIICKFYEEKLKHDRWMKKKGAAPCPVCGVMVEKGRTLCFFCTLELEKKNSENLRILIEDMPWISYREAAANISPLSVELYLDVKNRIKERLYREIVESMEKADSRNKNIVKSRIITLAMLETGKKPSGLSDDVLKKNLPQTMYDFYNRK